MHSHNYTLRQLYGRKFIEGEADAFIYRRRSSWTGLGRGVARAIGRDLLHHLARLEWLPALAAPVRRSVEGWAHFRGHRLGEDRLHRDDRDASVGQRTVLSRYG